MARISTVQVAISIPKDLKEELMDIAERETRSFSNLIVVLIREALDKREE